MASENETTVDELETLRRTNIELLAKVKKHKERCAALETELTSVKASADELVEAASARLQRVANNAKVQLVRSLASELFVVPRFGEKYVAERLNVSIDEKGESVVAVIEEDGKTTDKSVDDLKKELRDNHEFAPLLIGSRASGGAGMRTGTGGTPRIASSITDTSKKVQRLGLR